MYNDEVYCMLNTEYNTNIVEKDLGGNLIQTSPPKRSRTSSNLSMEKLFCGDDDETIIPEKKPSTPADDMVYAIDENKYDDYLKHIEKNSFVVNDLTKFKEAVDLWAEVSSSNVSRLLHKNLISEKDYKALIDNQKFFGFDQLNQDEFITFATKLAKENVCLFEDK